MLWSPADDLAERMTDDHRKIQLVMELRNKGVRDTRVLDAMERIPREAFVDERFALRPMPTRRCRSPAARRSASPSSSPS
jgi:protein-L-isoaspartate O-methyltransferase